MKSVLVPQMWIGNIIFEIRTIMSALSNLYGFYPIGTGPNLPDNVNVSLFLPPNPNMIVPDIGLKSTPLLF